jgi:MFS family permease
VYACGITPYDVTHLGHAATFVWTDTLCRVLRAGGAEVLLCRNVTDVDDVLLAAADRAGEPYDRFAAIQVFYFEQDMAALGVGRPSVEPRAHAYIKTGARPAAGHTGPSERFGAVACGYFPGMSDAGGGTETAASAPRLVPLRRNHGFRMLWAGQLLSDTGSQVGLLAYPLLILALTHSAVLAGVVGTAREVTLIALQLPAGALADRLDRRLTMIICDSMRAALMVGLCVLIAVHLASWPVVLVVSMAEGGAGAIFDPSATAALPAIVPDRQLEEAWAATEARTYGAWLVGPALGGVLFGLGRAVPFLADAVSYGVSLGTVSRLRGRFRPEKPAERKALWREVGDGLRIVWRVPILRATVIQGPLINFAFNGVLFTITLSLRQHGTSATVIGLVQTGIAAGGLLGAVAATRVRGRLNIRTLTIAMSMTGVVLYCAAALLIPSPLVLLPVAIVPLLSPAANAALFAGMLRAAPEEMRGRVSNTVVMLAMALAALAPLLAGLLVEHVSGAWAIGAFAAAQAVAALLCLTMSGLRQAESLAAAPEGSPPAGSG